MFCFEQGQTYSMLWVNFMFNYVRSFLTMYFFLIWWCQQNGSRGREYCFPQVVPAEDLRKASEGASAAVRTKKTATYLWSARRTTSGYRLMIITVISARLFIQEDHMIWSDLAIWTRSNNYQAALETTVDTNQQIRYPVYMTVYTW